MIGFLHHWVYQDIYQPAFPNWIAGLVAAPIAFFWGKAFEKRAILRHNDMKQHITKEHEKSRRHLELHVKGSNGYNRPTIPTI
jgi:hypothetical protein